MGFKKAHIILYEKLELLANIRESMSFLKLIEKRKNSMSMDDYLPTICDEIIYEDDYHKITKIAQFNKECYVNTYDDKWYVRPEWGVEYVLTEYGRKIRPYVKGELESLLSDRKVYVEVSDKIALCEERNRISFFMGNRCGITDLDGNVKIFPKYRNVSSIHDELIVMVDKDGYYLLTDQEDLLLKHNKVLSTYGNLITIWEDKPQILRYQCKQKAEEKPYMHISELKKIRSEELEGL